MLRGLLLLLLPPLLAALGLAPLAGGAALAHQQKIAISTIALNARSGAIEIAHQVPVHDAEHALRAQGAKNADIIGSEKSREAFARYVTQRFLLQVDGTAVEPAYVGSEITGGSLWVYQEVPAPPGGQAVLRFNSQILTDVWARQENRVNIGGGTRVDTFIFRAGTVAADARITP
jgi:hypothetical protein